MSIKQEDIDLAIFSEKTIPISSKKHSSTSVDFKMVTFTLSGKRYGIDIMKVKEIRKASNFTYVPNIEPYVRGVDNLRGDIIPIIDMRLMFSLPVPELTEGELENVIVLRFEDQLLGIVVDTVEKVVGSMKENIRPPHPLFGDINIRYLSGVIEENNYLYVILNMDSILLSKKEKDLKEEQKEDISDSRISRPAPILSSACQTSDRILESGGIRSDDIIVSSKEWQREREDQRKKSEEGIIGRKSASRIVDLVMSLEDQIGETEKQVAQILQKEANFYLSPLNTEWFLSQKVQWQTSIPASEELLKSFYSPFSGRLWEENYLEEFERLLKENLGPELVKNVLVPGCAEGYDAYVVACAIKRAFGDIRYKVWASDNDLTHIMKTQSLSFPVESTPGVYMDRMLNTNTGLQFDSEIKESILFEYSDVIKADHDKQVGLILACDLLSFLSQEYQVQVLMNFASQLDEDGLLIVGCRENIDRLLDSWVPVISDKFKVYKKQKN